MKEERIEHMTNCYITWHRKKGNKINMNVRMNVFSTLSRSASALMMRNFLQKAAAIFMYNIHGIIFIKFIIMKESQNINNNN